MCIAFRSLIKQNVRCVCKYTLAQAIGQVEYQRQLSSGWELILTLKFVRILLKTMRVWWRLYRLRKFLNLSCPFFMTINTKWYWKCTKDISNNTYKRKINPDIKITYQLSKYICVTLKTYVVYQLINTCSLQTIFPCCNEIGTIYFGICMFCLCVPIKQRNHPLLHKRIRTLLQCLSKTVLCTYEYSLGE